MTTTSALPDSAPQPVAAAALTPSPASSLFTPALLLLCVTNALAMLSFYLLLTVVPTYAVTLGLGGVGAGTVAGAMMLAAVAAEVVAPKIIGRFGYRTAICGGLLLLGLPAFALHATAGLLPIMAISGIRGAGFGLLVVAIGGLATTVLPADRRGEGLGLIGVSSSLPAVAGLPLGVFLIDRIGYPGLFAAGAVVALAGALTAAFLPAGSSTTRPAGMAAVLKVPRLRHLALIFTAAAMAASVLATFLPAAADSVSTTTVAAALLLYTAAAAAARWAAGRLIDRHGPGRFVAPSVAASAAGLAAFAWTSSPTVVCIAAVLFGVGFGTAQAATSTAMFDYARPAQYAAVSAVWNLAFDTGLGVGAAAFGLLASHTGYPAGFIATAGVVLLTLVLLRAEPPASWTRTPQLVPSTSQLTNT
jgi:predicted MFS family arabinose efflux permease